MTYEEAHEFFYYKSGKLYRKINSGTAKIGDLAGKLNNHGRMRISCKKKSYQEHRVIWLMHNGGWPKETIDHINRDYTDNRIENLRDISHRDNCQNNGFKHPGVSKKGNKWIAYLMVKGKNHISRLFVLKEDAISARKQLEEKYL